MGNKLSILEKEILGHFVKEDFARVTYLCNELLRQARSCNDKYYEASSYGITGYMNYELLKFEEAIALLEKAMSICREGERGFIDTGHMALCYSRLDDMEKAGLYVDMAVDAAIRLDHHPAKYDWFNFKGNVLFKKGQHARALEWVDKSINEIPYLINPARPEIIFYQPYLTKLEILCASGWKDECGNLMDRLNEFFGQMENPVLHVRRDKEKYMRLSAM